MKRLQLTILIGFLGANVLAQNKIEASGNVGIGTTNPQYPLHILKTSGAPAVNIGGGFSGSPRLQIYGLENDPGAWMGLGSDMGGGPYEHSIYFPSTVNGHIGKLSIGNYNGTAYIPRLWVNSNGNVGVGIADPTSKLSVSPIMLSGVNIASILNVGTRDVLSSVAGSYLYPFEFQHSNYQNFDRLQLAPYRRLAGTGWEGTAYRMQFAVDNSYTDGTKAYIEVGASDPNARGGGFISLATQGSDRLVVTSSGFVGIGTASPKELLSVNGNIRSREIKVEDQNWPDYVFKPGYKLPTLTEVKKYIDEHQHLEGLPSAEQVAKDGLSLGEMNRLLAQKVEELTLYLIEKDREVKTQKQEFDKLQQQLIKLEKRMAALEK